MSQNGQMVVLDTPAPDGTREYRVKHMDSDFLYWEFDKSKLSQDELIENARKWFLHSRDGEGQIFSDEEAARDAVEQAYQDAEDGGYFIEYGPARLKIERVF